jgi:cytochrome bd ubiquinol oxidase subunit I
VDLDPVLLAHLQFAFTIIVHINFPAFTIGLSAHIPILGPVRMRTGTERYRVLAQFWTKIFAVSCSMGVVTGIVLSYQFGTNRSRFLAVLGNVIGPMIAYEILAALFPRAAVRLEPGAAGNDFTGVAVIHMTSHQSHGHAQRRRL